VTEPIVTDESAELWYRPSRQSNEPDSGLKSSLPEGPKDNSPVEDVADSGIVDDIEIRISLFGILAMQIPERPMVLTMPRATTVSHIITNLEKKYLHSIPEMAAEDPAGLSPYCRVFIDGYPLEDFDHPLDNGKPAIELEMILLLAYEGG
tara:strand:+ start:1079 stop:1528 length:450 start_codon:yes stop_codon:yes gene_type:complete